MRLPRLLPALTLTVVVAAATACGDDGNDTTDDTAADTADDAAVDRPGAAPSRTDPVVGVGTTELGDVLVDSSGLSLYAFLTDMNGQSSCYDACAKAWPPLLIDGPDLPDGLDPAVFSVTERTDRTHQLVAGDWPLYTYVQDAAPGDITGQGSGGVWYLVAPDGQPISETPTGDTRFGY